MPATWVAITVAIVFLVPGFRADFLLGNWIPRAKREATEVVLTALLFTLVSFIPLSLLVVPVWVQADQEGYRLYARAHATELTFIAIGALIALPVAEALIVGNLLKWPRFVAWVERWLGLRIRSSPKAWDFLWGQDRRFYAIVTFTDGDQIAGGWGRNSWASGFPNDEDIYFEVVYSLKDGRLDAVVPHTAGLLLKRDDIRSIELIDYDTWEVPNGQGTQNSTITASSSVSDSPTDED